MHTFTAPIGTDNDGNTIEVEINQSNFAHGILFGRTGCGKSVALATLLSNLSEKYTPEDIEVVYLSGNYPTPSIETLPLTTHVFPKEQTQEAIAYFRSVIEERLVYANDNELSAISTANLPAIIVAVENYSEELTELLRTLTSVGRSLGIHLILVRQTTYPSTLPSDIAQMFGWALAFEESTNLALEWTHEKINDAPKATGKAVLATGDTATFVAVFDSLVQ